MLETKRCRRPKTDGSFPKDFLSKRTIQLIVLCSCAQYLLFCFTFVKVDRFESSVLPTYGGLSRNIVPGKHTGHIFQTEYHGPCGPMVISNQASSVYTGYPVTGNDAVGSNVVSGGGSGSGAGGGGGGGGGSGSSGGCGGGIGGGAIGSSALSSGGSGNTYNSRRSSYSPSDRSRGRDSIVYMHGGEIPISVTPWHRSILILFEVSVRKSLKAF